MAALRLAAMVEPLDAGTLAFAHRVFDLAREGAEGEPAELLDAGLLFELPDMVELLEAHPPRPR